VNLLDRHVQAVLVELGLLALIVLALAGGMRLCSAAKRQAAPEQPRTGLWRPFPPQIRRQTCVQIDQGSAEEQHFR
jgi:hypothetical protein